jgi:hypothetical protein
MLYVADRLQYSALGYSAGMKLPLFHHGYQGKHERVEVPRQRGDEPEPPNAEQEETGEEQDTTRSANGGRHAKGGEAPVPAAATVAEAVVGAAGHDGDADAMPEGSGEPGRV